MLPKRVQLISKSADISCTTVSANKLFYLIQLLDAFCSPTPLLMDLVLSLRQLHTNCQSLRNKNAVSLC